MLLEVLVISVQKSSFTLVAVFVEVPHLGIDSEESAVDR